MCEVYGNKKTAHLRGLQMAAKWYFLPTKGTVHGAIFHLVVTCRRCGGHRACNRYLLSADDRHRYDGSGYCGTPGPALDRANPDSGVCRWWFCGRLALAKRQASTGGNGQCQPGRSHRHWGVCAGGSMDARWHGQCQIPWGQLDRHSGNACTANDRAVSYQGNAGQPARC